MKAQSIKRAFLKKLKHTKHKKPTLNRDSFDYPILKNTMIFDDSESCESQSQNLFIQPIYFRELFLNIENQDVEKNYFNNSKKIR